MEEEKNNSAETISKKTIKDLHAEVKSLPLSKMRAVLEVFGSESDQTFYDLLQGRKKVKSQVQREAIAAIYNTTADQIDWKDAETEKAIA